VNLRELEYLVALADTGHFGQAAQACGVSQPTLSAQIRRLEDDLGVGLVARGRRAELTAAGERVTELARQMLALSDDIHAAARECAGQPAPPLRVGVFPTLAPYLAGPLLRGIAVQQPDLQIVIVEQPTNDLLAMLEQRAVDVALIATPVTPMLSRVPLFREDFLLAVPASDPLAGTTPIHPLALRGRDLLLMSEGHCLRDQALDVCAESGAGHRLDMAASSIGPLLELVAAGSGPTILPRMAIPPQRDARLCLREFVAPRPHRDIALVARPTVVLRPQVQQLVDVCHHLPTDEVVTLEG